MSAIGDYIHRSLKGYIGENTKPPYLYQAESAYKLKQDRIQTQIENMKIDAELENAAKELETILNDFLSQKILKDEYNNWLEEFNDDFFTTEFPQYITEQFLKVAGRSINGSQVSTKIKEINMNTKNPSILKEQVSKKLELIKRNIDLAIKKGQIGKNNVTELSKQYEDLKDMFDEISKNVKTLNKNKNANFFTQLNTLINKVEFSNEFAYARGQALESFVPFIVNHINKTVLNKIAFTTSEKLGGKESKSLPGVATENFAKDINLVDIMSEQGQRKITKYPNFVSSIQIPTEDKIDFYLTFKGDDIGFSAKNYAVSGKNFRGITLVKGQSLLTLLQNENEENFINHYLTLIQPLDTSNASDELNTNIDTWRSNYNQLVYQLLLIKALTGYNVLKYDINKSSDNIFITDAAQFLIINDSAANSYKGNNIKVISMQMLINKIFNNINSVSLSMGSGKSYNQLSFANFTLQPKPYQQDQQTVEERITDILMRVHAQKVHMTLKADFVKYQIFDYKT